MKVNLTLIDFRLPGKSIYKQAERRLKAVNLDAGRSIFAEIELTKAQEKLLNAAMQKGSEPVFYMSQIKP